MPVFRWRESWDPLRDLERQVDRLLESLPFPFPRFDRPFPPVNLYELDGEYLLTADEERNAIADRCQIDTMASFQKRPADLSNWQYHFGQPLDRAGNLRNEFFGP